MLKRILPLLLVGTGVSCAGNETAAESILNRATTNIMHAIDDAMINDDESISISCREAAFRLQNLNSVFIAEIDQLDDRTEYLDRAGTAVRQADSHDDGDKIRLFADVDGVVRKFEIHRYLDSNHNSIIAITPENASITIDGTFEDYYFMFSGDSISRHDAEYYLGIEDGFEHIDFDDDSDFGYAESTSSNPFVSRSEELELTEGGDGPIALDRLSFVTDPDQVSGIMEFGTYNPETTYSHQDSCAQPYNIVISLLGQYTELIDASQQVG